MRLKHGLDAVEATPSFSFVRYCRLSLQSTSPQASRIGLGSRTAARTVEGCHFPVCESSSHGRVAQLSHSPLAAHMPNIHLRKSKVFRRRNGRLVALAASSIQRVAHGRSWAVDLSFTTKTQRVLAFFITCDPWMCHRWAGYSDLLCRWSQSCDRRFLLPDGGRAPIAARELRLFRGCFCSVCHMFGLLFHSPTFLISNFGHYGQSCRRRFLDHGARHYTPCFSNPGGSRFRATAEAGDDPTLPTRTAVAGP